MFSVAQRVPRGLSALLVILALATGTRLAYLFTTGSRVPQPIEGEVAHNILADGRWFARNLRAAALTAQAQRRSHHLIDPASVDYALLDRNGRWLPSITHPVGVAAVIAAVWAITGDERYVQAQLVQVLADVLAALLVYWIAMQLFARRRVALLAAGLYALYPPIAWQTLDLYDDIWAVDFTIAIVALYLLMSKSPHRWRWLILCGALTGIGAYFRPQVLILAPALSLATIATTGPREAIRRAATVVAVAATLIAPWTVRNYIDFHTFIPIRSGLWETMSSGLQELPSNFANDIEAQAHRAQPGFETETPEWDARLKPYFVHAVEKHPFFYLETVAHRAVMSTLLLHDTVWMHQGAADLPNSSRTKAVVYLVTHPFVALEYAVEPGVFLLAILGLALTWRRWRKQNTILLTVAAAIVLPYLPIHIESRFLLPVAFIYFIWISLGIDLIVEWAKRRARGEERELIAAPGGYRLGETAPRVG